MYSRRAGTDSSERVLDIGKRVTRCHEDIKGTCAYKATVTALIILCVLLSPVLFVFFLVWTVIGFVLCWIPLPFMASMWSVVCLAIFLGKKSGASDSRLDKVQLCLCFDVCACECVHACATAIYAFKMRCLVHGHLPLDSANENGPLLIPSILLCSIQENMSWTRTFSHLIAGWALYRY